MSCPHGEWHEKDCEICQSIDDAFEAGRNPGKARIAELEAMLRLAMQRECEWKTTDEEFGQWLADLSAEKP